MEAEVKEDILTFKKIDPIDLVIPKTVIHRFGASHSATQKIIYVDDCMVSYDNEQQEMFPTQLLEFIKGLMPLTVILVL